MHDAVAAAAADDDDKRIILSTYTGATDRILSLRRGVVRCCVVEGLVAAKSTTMYDSL